MDHLKEYYKLNNQKEYRFTTTFWLCYLFGFLGFHRFYTGQWWIGIFQLFTLGGFGIWSMIDLALIISGKYKDANENNLIK